MAQLEQMLGLNDMGMAPTRVGVTHAAQVKAPATTSYLTTA